MRIPSVLPLLVGAISIGGAVASSPAATTVVERRVATMGTTLAVSVEGAAPRGVLMAEAERLVAQVEATERRLSTWRDDSELARINRSPVGDWQSLSETTSTELDIALHCAAWTSGAFDPTVAPLVEVWGLRTGGRRPAKDQLAEARRRTGWARIALDPSARRLRKLAPRRSRKVALAKAQRSIARSNSRPPRAESESILAVNGPGSASPVVSSSSWPIPAIARARWPPCRSAVRRARPPLQATASGGSSSMASPWATCSTREPARRRSISAA